MTGVTPRRECQKSRPSSELRTQRNCGPENLTPPSCKQPLTPARTTAVSHRSAHTQTCTHRNGANSPRSARCETRHAIQLLLPPVVEKPASSHSSLKAKAGVPQLVSNRIRADSLLLAAWVVICTASFFGVPHFPKRLCPDASTWVTEINLASNAGAHKRVSHRLCGGA